MKDASSRVLLCIRRVLPPALLIALLIPVSVVCSDMIQRPLLLPRSEAQRVELINRLGGPVTAGIPLSDGTVIVAQGSTLIRVDLSGSAPLILSQNDPGHGVILDMGQVGDFLYVLTEEGVAVMRVSIEELTGPVSFAAGGGQALAVRQTPDGQSTLIAVAARQAGLRLLRADAQGMLSVLPTLPVDGEVLDVTLMPDGSRAYIAAGNAGLLIADLGDPMMPHLIGSLPVSPAEAVGSVGALLAVGSDEYLAIVDPTAGAEGGTVGVYAPLHEGRRIVVQGEYAFIADTRDGLKIIWLAAPGHPTQIYGEIGHPAYDLWVDDDMVWIVGSDGLRILNAGSRYRPLEISRLLLPGLPQGIYVTPGRAFVALGAEGVGVVNIENLSSPRLSRRIPLDGVAHAVTFDGETLYVAAGEAGLAVVDPARPRDETLLGVFPLPGEALDIVRRGSTLFVAGGSAGLLSVDVTQPAAPTLADVLPAESGHSINHVVLRGRQAFLSDGAGFTIADVESPYEMVRIARVEAPSTAIGAGDTTLYALSGDRIALYDARTLGRPILQQVYTGMGHISHISAAGERVFVTGTGDGPDLLALSLLAPDYPVELDSTDITGQSYRAWPDGASVWLARGYAGLYRYDVSEGGALLLRGVFATVQGAEWLVMDDAGLLVGGHTGWSLLGLAGDGQPDLLARVFDNLPVRGMALDGETVAIAAGDADVLLYTREDTITPRLLAHHDTHGPATGIALDEGYVYVADAGGLSIYDRHYLSPVMQISTPSPANGLVRRGNRAYLPLADGRLAIIALADPAGGLYVRSTVNTRRPGSLILSPGGRSVYSLADDTLLRLSVADPDHLTVTGSGRLAAFADHGFFIGSLLWAISPGEAARIYNVGYLNGGAIPPSGRIRMSGGDIAVNGNIAYIAYGERGLGLMNLITRDAGTIFYDGPTYALYRDGDTLFALGSSLTAWDVTQAASPRLVAVLPMFAPGQHIAPGDDGRLLLSLEGGIAIAVRDGTTLTLVGQLPVPGGVDRAVQTGTRAYLALHQGGLLVVDLSNPAQPRSLFSYTSPSGQFIHDMLLLDDENLLVSWESGIDILGVSATSSVPYLLNTFDTGEAQALDLSLSADGSRGVLSLGEAGVLLLDLSDPDNPQVIGHVDTPGDGLAAALSGETGVDALYVADGTCGLRVIDVTDPASPREQGYWLSSFASDVAVHSHEGDSVVYLAEANQLLTLRYNPTAPPLLPPMPQFASPANGQDAVPLSPMLTWGPPPDPCNPSSYNIYLGLTEAPPFVGQVIGEPALLVSELAPLRTYYWQVEATDWQGDVIRGPLWRFTTAPAEFPDAAPSAPPPLVERLRQNPAIPAGMVGVAIAVAVIGWLRWRVRRRSERAGRSGQPDEFLSDE